MINDTKKQKITFVNILNTFILKIISTYEHVTKIKMIYFHFREFCNSVTNTESI